MTKTKKIILEAKNLTHSYQEGVSTFQDLSFSLYEHEIFCLLGPSGCGKSTLLQCLTGFESPLSGEIIFKGKNLQGVAPEKRGFGLVFQDYSLFPHLTIADNISYGLGSADKKTKDARVQELLALLNLKGHEKKYPFELSGGEQQRVAIARAMAPSPELILFDEPFSNLDPALRENLRLEVKDILLETKTSAIFITHDQEEAFDLGDRIGVLHQGKIQQVGTPFELYHQPQTEFIARFLGSNHFIHATQKDGVLETSFGVFPKPENCPEAQELLIYIPHSHLSLDQDLKGSEATVLRRYFRGESYSYDVRLNASAQEFTHITDLRELKIGQKVKVHIKREGLQTTFPRFL